ncbi:MAG: helix-turn-helix domain-containing protein, partial [Clostridia bacterium]|nr:helix-turn-helix domain-containing protein [Clostridia bacterium]
MTEFGTRLKDLRICHNMTQDEAAAAISVSKQAISKWENDRGLPDVASLGALAELYGTTIDYLLTGEEKVRVEKEVEIVEVEKEKIVEVEKQLTKDMLTAILVQYQRWSFTAYGWVVFSPFLFAAGIVMLVLALPNFSNALIAPLIVGIMFI